MQRVWVHKCCSGVKGSLSAIPDTSMCKVCERVSDGEDINRQEVTDMGNTVCLDRFEKVLLSGRYAEWSWRS